MYQLGYIKSFPYFVDPLHSPQAYRLLMPFLINIFEKITGLDVVQVGYGLLVVGFYTSMVLLYRLLREDFSVTYSLVGIVLAMVTPYLFTLPWGQLQGDPISGIHPAWHLGHYTEGIVVPGMIIIVWALRRRMHWLIIFITVIILFFTKEIIGIMGCLTWFLGSPRQKGRYIILLMLIGLFIGYGVLRYCIIGDRPAYDASFIIWQDFPTRFSENIIGILLLPFTFLGSWVLVLKRTTHPFYLMVKPVLPLFMGFHLLLSCFWETRLYLPLIPLIIPMIVHRFSSHGNHKLLETRAPHGS